MAHLHVTTDDYALIRTAIANAGSEYARRGFPEWAQQMDDLLDRLPEPLDELWLGIPNQGRRVWHRWHDPREAAYEAENGGL